MSTTSLTPDQKQTVAAWVAAGDSLSSIQKKLAEEFRISMTYMDVRFLVDDLNLNLKDAAPKAEPTAGLEKPPEKSQERKGFFDKAKEKLGLGKEEAEGEAAVDEEAGFGAEETPPAGRGGVRVTVDKVTLLPGAVASGTVAFSDGVSGKWFVDNYGRPALSEMSRPNYRPSPPDAQAFMEELNLALQKRGF